MKPLAEMVVVKESKVTSGGSMILDMEGIVCECEKQVQVQACAICVVEE